MGSKVCFFFFLCFSKIFVAFCVLDNGWIVDGVISIGVCVGHEVEVQEVQRKVR